MENIGQESQSNPHPLKFRSDAHQASPAGFWIRFVALFVDGLILTVVIVPVFYLMGWYEKQSVQTFDLSQYMLQQIVSWTIFGIYGGYFYSQKGATPGKMIFKIEVLNAETNQRLSFVQGFLRDSLCKIVSYIPMSIGYLMAAFRADKRTLHDYIVGSKVIRRD